MKTLKTFLLSASSLLGLTALVGSLPCYKANAAVPQGVLINFQPGSSAIPTIYDKDTGAAYSDTLGSGWVRQDSLSSTTHVPLDLTPNTRDRNRTGIDQRLDTLIHMQATSSATGVATPAAWEYTIPNGIYQVTVSLGDQPNSGGVYDSQNTINVEGVNAINRFQGNSTQEYKQATIRVNVTDGRLTVDAIGGTNTKLNYIEIHNAPPLGQTTYTVPVIGDSSVALRQSEPNYNRNANGVKGGLFSGYDGTSPSAARFYLKFKLPTLVPGTKVVSARIIGFYNDDYNPGNDGGHGMYYVGTDSWSETTITWDNQPGQFFGTAESFVDAAQENVGSFVDWPVTYIVDQMYQNDSDRLISFLSKAGDEALISTNQNWEYFVEKDFDRSKAFRIEFTVGPQ